MKIILEYNLLYISMISTVLISLLVAARFLLGRRIHRVFFSLAWMIVLVRLLLPLCITVPVGCPETLDKVYEWVRSFPVGQYFLIWAVGAAVSVIFFVVRYVMWGRILREALPIQKVPDIDEEMFTFMGIRVYVSDRIASPVTYGIFQQKVLLPKYYMELTREQLKFILIHEKVHIDGHDNLNKCLVILAVCLHWFNPFAWLMYICYNRDLELACDEKVIRQVGEDNRKDYAGVLISLAQGRPVAKPIYSGFAQNAVKERIVMIMGYRRVRVWNYILCGVLVLFSLVVFAVPVKTEEVVELTPQNKHLVSTPKREEKEKEEEFEAVEVSKVIEEDSIGTKAEVLVKTKEKVSLRIKILFRKELAVTNGSFISFQTKGKEWEAGIDDEYDGTVTIPEAVRYKGKVYPVKGIGNYTFYQCRKLRKVLIPNTVEEIKEKAFESCESLKTLQMPENLELVEANPFVGCRSLKSFQAPEGTRMKGQYQVKEGVLYTDYGRFLKVFPQGKKQKKFVLEEGMLQIAVCGFYGTQVEEVYLPESMLRVKSRAFQNCQNLREVRAHRETVFSGDALTGAWRARILHYN